MDLLGSAPGLWFSAITCTTAALLSFRGGMLGIVQHRFPRILLAVAVAVIAVSYWFEIFTDGSGASARRGAGWILWPSLAWVAWSGIHYSRVVVQRAEEMWREHEGNGGP